MTMSSSEPIDFTIRFAARRAYELGRLRGALRRGGGALVLALPAYLACGRTPAAAACLVLFALMVAGARFHGEGFEEGSRAGLLAGLLPCLLPAGLRLASPDLCDVLFARGPWLCAAAGVAAGVILGLRSRTSGGAPFWMAAVATFSAAAALGCIPAGLMGFSGLLVGVVAGGLPAIAARRISA
jgi:hypothetical protein